MARARSSTRCMSRSGMVRPAPDAAELPITITGRIVLRETSDGVAVALEDLRVVCPHLDLHDADGNAMDVTALVMERAGRAIIEASHNGTLERSPRRRPKTGDSR